MFQNLNLLLVSFITFNNLELFQRKALSPESLIVISQFAWRPLQASPLSTFGTSAAFLRTFSKQLQGRKSRLNKNHYFLDFSLASEEKKESFKDKGYGINCSTTASLSSAFSKAKQSGPWHIVRIRSLNTNSTPNSTGDQGHFSIRPCSFPHQRNPRNRNPATVKPRFFSWIPWQTHWGKPTCFKVGAEKCSLQKLSAVRTMLCGFFQPQQ